MYPIQLLLQTEKNQFISIYKYISVCLFYDDRNELKNLHNGYQLEMSVSVNVNAGIKIRILSYNDRI